MKLIDKQNRSKLGEGRSYQMGFAFVKQNPDYFETVQPVSTCKDYLNDVVWSEHTGKEIVAYGLKYSKQNLFTDPNWQYLAIGILPFQHGGTYENFAKDTDNLKNNYKLLQKFINYFEDKLGLILQSSITPSDIEGRYIVKFPEYWRKGTWYISLYTLLMRAGQFWNGKKDPMKYLEEFNEFAPDAYLVKSMLPKLKKLLEVQFVEQKLEDLPGGTTAHNCGIISCNMF